ncbi:MAG: glycosyltransferase family 4 protein [Pseudomonadota bacterium]
MSDLKKICFLLPTHFSAYGGGAEYQVRFVLDALCKKGGYEIYYLCRDVAPDFIAKDYYVRKVGNGSGLKRFGLYFDVFRLYSAIKQIRPQIIYQNVGCAYTGIAALYAKKYGAKFIWHIASDNDVVPQTKAKFRRKLISAPDRFLLNYGIKNADVIAGQTQYQNSLLGERFGRKCDVFIPIGHPFPEEVAEKLERVAVLWVANLKQLKQPEVFVRLARELCNNCKASFVMMGRPGESTRWLTGLMEQIKNTPNLEYLGEVSQDEVNRRLSEGHILVNTSCYEGFSNTFVQAWMRKVPVVSLTVDPDDILVRERMGFCSGTFTKLCNDVTRLIQNKRLREDMGERAQSYAATNHNVKKMVKKVVDLLA